MKSRFILCIDDRGEPDLECSKVYPVIRDLDAEKHRMVRIVDASGEDYLYPLSRFVEVEVSSRAAARLRESARVAKRASA